MPQLRKIHPTCWRGICRQNAWHALYQAMCDGVAQRVHCALRCKVQLEDEEYLY